MGSDSGTWSRWSLSEGTRHINGQEKTRSAWQYMDEVVVHQSGNVASSAFRWPRPRRLALTLCVSQS